MPRNSVGWPQTALKGSTSEQLIEWWSTIWTCRLWNLHCSQESNSTSEILYFGCIQVARETVGTTILEDSPRALPEPEPELTSPENTDNVDLSEPTPTTPAHPTRIWPQKHSGW